MIYHITNCRLVDGEKSLQGDILIKNGRIKLIGREKIQRYLYEYKEKYHLPGLHIRDKEEIVIIDGKSKTVMPSFADLHFHLRNPGQEHKESLESGNAAATKGGYTHLLAMANTQPVIDTVELVERLQDANDSLGLCRLYQASAVTKGLMGKELVDFRGIRRETRFFSDDGKNVDSAELMEKALLASRDVNFIILDHSEEETEMVRRNVDLAIKTGGNLHLCHISKKASMEIIMAAKEKGYQNITVEVSPHHIYGWEIDYRVNPPFATKEDRDFLIEAIRDGYVDAIATDHAPHTDEDKAKGAPGISGIETAFSLVHRVFLQQSISLRVLSRLMSYCPMRFLGEKEHLIMEGAPADLVMIEEGRYYIDKETFISKGKNTPFDKMEINGRVVMTMRNGNVLYQKEA